MYKVGETVSGNILVEMTPREWEGVRMFFRTTPGFTLSLSEELTKYRRDNNLSQREVAAKLEISNSYVSRIERGLVSNISPQIHQRIIKLVRGEEE